MSHVSRGVALTLVDCKFFLVWFRCPFVGCGSFGIVLLDIAFCQHWPSYVVSCFDGF